MKLENGEVITLEDGKEYIVFNSILKEGVNYVFLISNFKPVEICFAKEIIDGENISLEIINDQKQKEELMKYFDVR